MPLYTCPNDPGHKEFQRIEMVRQFIACDENGEAGEIIDEGDVGGELGLPTCRECEATAVETEQEAT